MNDTERLAWLANLLGCEGKDDEVIRKSEETWGDVGVFFLRAVSDGAEPVIALRQAVEVAAAGVIPE